MRWLNKPKNGEFTFYYTFLILICVLPFIIASCLWKVDQGFLVFLVPLLLFGIPILIIYLIAYLIIHIIRSHWQSALAVIASPFLVIGILLLAEAVQLPYVTDWLQFKIKESYYLERISKIPVASGIPRTHSFPEGGWGFVGTDSGEYSIEYDESDKIALASKTNPCANVRHMSGHFYLLAIDTACYSQP
ncbi:MAG TPA: hypothetical protein VFT64_02385 [Rickettsiales bacterium]|nr:hypothetical protein [Rickettsiales bacterium]